MIPKSLPIPPAVFPKILYRFLLFQSKETAQTGIAFIRIGVNQNIASSEGQK
jgi:hypothetical protein